MSGRGWHVTARPAPGGPEGAVHLAWQLGGRAAMVAEALAALRDDPAFVALFAATLAGFPVALRFETPPVAAATLDRAFECVVLPDPSLEIAADPGPFAAHFGAGAEVAAFGSLGGDARLIAPCPCEAAPAGYAHLLAFLRGAPPAQVAALWRRVAVELLDLVARGPGPLWLSTAGAGVAWLHVRLDTRPKYYVYAPFRAAGAQQAGRGKR